MPSSYRSNPFARRDLRTAVGRAARVVTTKEKYKSWHAVRRSAYVSRVAIVRRGFSWAAVRFCAGNYVSGVPTLTRARANTASSGRSMTF